MFLPGCPLNQTILFAFQITEQPDELENSDIALTLRQETREGSERFELKTVTIGTVRVNESHLGERGRWREAGLAEVEATATAKRR